MDIALPCVIFSICDPLTVWSFIVVLCLSSLRLLVMHFLHWLWLLKYFCPSPWMYYRLKMVAGVDLAVAWGKHGYFIGSSSSLKTFVTVVYTLLSPHVFLWLRPESSKLKYRYIKQIKLRIHPPNHIWDITKITIICKSQPYLHFFV